MKKNGFIPLDEILKTYEITENELVDLKIINDNAMIANDGYKYLILGHLEIIFVKEKLINEMLTVLKKTKIQIVEPQPPKETDGLGLSLLFWALIMITPVTYIYLKEKYPDETASFIFNAVVLIISLFALDKIFTNGIKKFFLDVISLTRKLLAYSIVVVVVLFILFVASLIFNTSSNNGPLCYYRVGCINE